MRGGLCQRELVCIGDAKKASTLKGLTVSSQLVIEGSLLSLWRAYVAGEESQIQLDCVRVDALEIVSPEDR